MTRHWLENCLSKEEIELMKASEQYQDDIEEARGNGYLQGYKDACKYYDDKKDKTPDEQS